MGNKQITVESKQFLEHERLGSTRVFEQSEKNAEGEAEDVPKMEITRNIQSKSLYQKWQTQLRKINDAEGRQLFLVPQTHSFDKAGLCGGNGFAKLTFNKFEFVLSSQIKNRNSLNKYFDETQIWYVLYNLVRAGNKFEILKQKIGDIHPNNILINEDGQTAIISNCSIPGEIDNFQKYIEDHKAEVFLAPEQMKAEDIEKGQYNQKVDKCLAQVFSIGLTLLSAGTLQHCNDVYQREPFKINTQRLNILKQQFAKRYSQYLNNTLLLMLQLNPQARVRSKKLYQTLSKFQNQILDLQPFIQYNQPTGYSAPFNNNGYYNQPYGVQPQPQYTNGGYQPPQVHVQYQQPANSYTLGEQSRGFTNNPLPNYVHNKY